MRPVDSDVVSSIQRHAAMTWAQRLKRVFNIDIEVCSRCGGSVKVIACIEEQDVIDRILAHLRETEQDIANLPLLSSSFIKFLRQLSVFLKQPFYVSD